MRNQEQTDDNERGEENEKDGRPNAGERMHERMNMTMVVGGRRWSHGRTRCSGTGDGNGGQDEGSGSDINRLRVCGVNTTTHRTGQHPSVQHQEHDNRTTSIEEAFKKWRVGGVGSIA